jgi:hypothetical protein
LKPTFIAFTAFIALTVFIAFTVFRALTVLSAVTAFVDGGAAVLRDLVVGLAAEADLVSDFF